MNRRPLADVVTELATAVQPDPLLYGGTRVTLLAVDAPIEVALRIDEDELLFMADLPRWRWRSVFDRQPGRLSLHLREEPV